ncbi:MAG: hypothetical protein LBJ08_09895 [Bifidobacteriaceae bacterium]|jgi:hypothetical protein|nr:hypothetical protein [Bifidobacteriaceae bacterium]
MFAATHGELKTVRAAIGVALEAIDDEEFELRFGATRDEARDVLARLE